MCFKLVIETSLHYDDARSEKLLYLPSYMGEISVLFIREIYLYSVPRPHT